MKNHSLDYLPVCRLAHLCGCPTDDGNPVEWHQFRMAGEIYFRQKRDGSYFWRVYVGQKNYGHVYLEDGVFKLHRRRTDKFKDVSLHEEFPESAHKAWAIIANN